jgi:hypothetical protein
MCLLYYSDLDQGQERRLLLLKLKQIYFNLSPQGRKVRKEKYLLVFS